MTRQEFLDELKRRLKGLSQDNLEERLNFYGEMIDDRMEEGLSEAEAVEALGTMDAIEAQILSEIPLTKLVKAQMKPRRRLSAWVIVLLAVGSPLWASLGIAAVAVILSVYAVLWSLVASAWAIFAALCAVAAAGIPCSVIQAVSVSAPSGGVLLGTALVGAGLAIFAFFGCLAATKGTARLTRNIGLAVKKCFMRKEKTE